MDQLSTNNFIKFEELEEIINLLKYTSDYDLSGYSRSSLKRRVERFLTFEKINLTELKDAIINIKNFSAYFVQELAVILTEMFRNPSFYQNLKNQVFPQLTNEQHIKAWSAGTGTGEESYSLAILLNENNLLNKSFIYGTDINQKALDIAKKGIYSIKKIKSYTDNYNNIGLSTDFSNHYTAMYNAAIINREYRDKILFSMHNLVTDQAFNEFQLILCRNVLIYFERNLQSRVLNVFYNSLADNGFLCLGAKETLEQHPIHKHFKIIDKTNNIYQKIA